MKYLNQWPWWAGLNKINRQIILGMRNMSTVHDQRLGHCWPVKIDLHHDHCESAVYHPKLKFTNFIITISLFMLFVTLKFSPCIKCSFLWGGCWLPGKEISGKTRTMTGRSESIWYMWIIHEHRHDPNTVIRHAKLAARSFQQSPWCSVMLQDGF